MKSICFSIVSHGQGSLASQLLMDLNSIDLSYFDSVQIIITLNIPENESFLKLCNLDYSIIRNNNSLGYGANHNQAFKKCNSTYFVILNPDIRLNNFKFDTFILGQKNIFGCAAPKVISPNGDIEDNARKYPTMLNIVSRVLLNDRFSDYILESKEKITVDWVAGMFILFPSEVFKKISGFDERYFMYLEDADICQRINKSGLDVIYDKSQTVIHDARRGSFKKFSHFRWHLKSMLRFIFRF